jgi:anthranilate phosphoribosyltransferase
LTRAIDALAARRDLSADETAEVLAEIMHGEVSETQIAGFLIALRTKGETIDEIVGLAQTMRELAAHVPTDRDDLLDTAGTGGGRRTFNVSTTAALIAAGAGCAVAKHGNRSATSSSGSADVLEALGARIDLRPDGVARCIEQAGFGFMFAPAHHQATRFVVPVRRELGVRTIFNLLGPLTNPAGASRQLIGVSDSAFLEPIAGALARLGIERALVVCAEDGLDEVSIAAGTKVVEVNGDRLDSYTLAPGDAGVETVAPDALENDCAGGTPEQNAAVARAILVGEQDADGASTRMSLALINAGAAIYAAGAASSIAEGVDAARAAIADGAAADALERYVRASHDNAPSAASS